MKHVKKILTVNCISSIFIFQAKYIAQIVVAGAQVVGRAFVRAVRQEYVASQQAAKRHASSPRETAKVAANDTYSGMTLQVSNLQIFWVILLSKKKRRQI